MSVTAALLRVERREPALERGDAVLARVLPGAPDELLRDPRLPEVVEARIIAGLPERIEFSIS